ncbi:hypothetical protein POM88_048907 [Heracleum sosnowskyi]|uniref:FBD domain-containing protein n=1 Tax=Heracleum sosnowskyi TaxID=360622 RepID=A0AAD8M030_9APIA|nr:hypothetical protein POM88_048907 [Heracleum sosnowskyi]
MAESSMRKLRHAEKDIIRGSPSKLSKPLPYLKTLTIYDIDFTILSEVSCVLCLIRNAPNLCKLHIIAKEDDGEGNLTNYSVEDSEDCTLHHLETISFGDFKCGRAEMELVKFLLAHSPSLKTINIHPPSWVPERRAQIRHLKHTVENNKFDHKHWYEYIL